MVAVSSMANRLFPQISYVAFCISVCKSSSRLFSVEILQGRKVRGKSIKSVINNPLNTLELNLDTITTLMVCVTHMYTHTETCGCIVKTRRIMV